MSRVLFAIARTCAGVLRGPSLLAGGFGRQHIPGTPGGTFCIATSAAEMADAPITYEDLPEDHKKKYDEIKAVFEADLIGSFERTRKHGIRWKGFSPEGVLDEVDLSLPSEERTRALRQEVNYMVAHSLHRHSESLVNAFERIAVRVVQEIMKHQYSPSGPTLGTHQGEAPFHTRPQLPFTLAAPEPQGSPAYVVYKVGGDPGDCQFLASNELWRIIQEGFNPYNPDKLTRREAVDSQLNNTALHMIQTSVGTKDLPRVRNYTTAKEAWEGLAASCIGSESTRRNKYNALRNQAEGFMRLPDEDHQDMYSRLLIVADSFRLIGATHINDSWIKEKYIECMMPYVPIDVKTLVGRECYSSLSSQDVVHEMQALKVLEQTLMILSIVPLSFWVDPSKAKEDNIKRNHKSGFTSFGPKTRSCYNCDDKRHFIAECPYENRELHNGRLIPKDKSKESKGKYSKAPNKKFYNNKTKKGKKTPRVVLVTREEYSSDEVVSSSDDEEGSSKEVAAIVTTNIPSSSLFESPNENPHIKNAHCFMATSSLDTSIVLSTQEEYSSGDDDGDDEEDATSNGLVALASLSTNSSSPSESPNEIIHVEEESCLMAKTSEVSSPSPSMPNISSDLGVDDASLKVKQEMLEFDEFMFNLQGINKKHVSNLMARLAQQNDMLEKKGQIERDSLEIHALKNALEESQETISSLEERLENLEEPQDEINKLTKARDHARAKTKLLKKEKAQFGVDHEKLVKDLDELDKAHKALKSEYSLLSKSNEQLQIRLASYDVPSSSTPSCDHANIIEEKARLKDELANQNKLSLDDLLSKQRSNNGKEGLGYNAKAKKANKQKAKPAQEKKKDITNGEAPKGNTTNDDNAGNANPHYVLFKDYYDQAHEVEHSQEIEEAQIEGQDGDPNDQVDQVTPPRPTKEEIEARRLARRERQLERLEHTHDKVLGDKVFEALEDSDWVEAMHEELNNFKRNKVWTLVEKPKECRNVIGTKWIFKNKQDEFGNILMTDRFEMSMMGEMKFFLGFEIKQLREGTFINQAKYLQDMLKRFKMTELKGVATPMVTKCHLALDPNGKEVDQRWCFSGWSETLKA
ncbi:hypothetical protein QYE76_054122 [Lolium multiflorum]|uniref:Reverse transcriptase Ty1/copia-type domain-containing protein n=1 Tax=Lolium multiflorum TaxID=4521 RepID=A0AAD8WMM1_LOLMU|nr:hypothetical protein QYE76_054122 [Lolium multiflorum]